MGSTAGILATPFGRLLVVVDDEAAGDRPAPVAGAVVSSGFLAPDAADPAVPAGAAEHPLLRFVAAAVADWAGGADPRALDRVPVGLPGSGFRLRAWQAMRSIPSGPTLSYQELAAAAGSPAAARAAGSACATNPVAPFVPCHRVVRQGGALGQYGYGPTTKLAILRHEGARA